MAGLWEFVKEIRSIFKIEFRISLKEFDLSSSKYRNLSNY